ncbi:MAG: GIY-YIG nuclease family protein [Bacteroidia bacterium]
MRFYIYILYSTSSDRYYVGQSHDPHARLKDHNTGDRPNQQSKYTFKHRPWELKASFCLGEERSLTIQVERYIKRQKSRKFIEQLIDFQEDLAQIAQLLRVPVYRD